MNARLQGGAQVVQGKHTISNPKASWYAALASALMIIDNRFSNQGRHNLGLSARIMGDSICVRTEILKSHRWGSGLTEDYDYRLRLLLEGIKIEYQPFAVGFGQAPRTWKEAKFQRLRWLKGHADTGSIYRWELFSAGFRSGDFSQVDGALSTLVPSYSTLALFSSIAFIFTLLLDSSCRVPFMVIGSATLILWFLYPFLGLALEKAPLQSYLVTVSGPFYILWRSWLLIRTKLLGSKINWVRTPHQ